MIAFNSMVAGSSMDVEKKERDSWIRAQNKYANSEILRDEFAEVLTRRTVSTD